MRPSSSGRLYGASYLGGPTEFYRLDVNEDGVSVVFDINQDGVSIIDSFPNMIPTYWPPRADFDPGDIEFASGLIYTESGGLIDPESRRLLGTFDAKGPVEPDTEIGLVYFLQAGELRNL